MKNEKLGFSNSEAVKNVQEMFKEAETSVSSFLKTYQEFIKTISSRAYSQRNRKRTVCSRC